jgi:hypothetical protein
MVTSTDDTTIRWKSDPKKMIYTKISSLSLPEVHQLDCTSGENDTEKQDIEEVQDFIDNFALSDQENGLSCTYLAYYDGSLVGYFTVSPSNISYETVKVKVQTRDEITRYPVILISNLGVDRKQRRRDFGSILLNRCMGLSGLIKDIVGIRYVILYTYTKEDFYSQNNKTPFKFTKIKSFNDGRKLMVHPLFS